MKTSPLINLDHGVLINSFLRISKINLKGGEGCENKFKKLVRLFKIVWKVFIKMLTFCQIYRGKKK